MNLSYVEKNIIKELISEGIDVKKIALTNIIELSESDYLDYSKQ